MTVINNKYKIIFVHVPKNGGTSVTNFFSQISTPLDIEIGGSAFGEIIQSEFIKRYHISKHSPAKHLKKVLGDQVWTDYKVVAVTRDPISRFVSTYNFLRRWNSGNDVFYQKINKFTNINDFIDSDFIFNENIPDNIFLPQSHWITDNGIIIVDNIFRLSNIENDLKNFIQKNKINLNLSLFNLPYLNSSGSTNIVTSVDLTDKSVSKIKYIYYRDYELFNF